MISTQELRALLLEKGADLVGFGDLKGIGETTSPFSRCVSLAVKLPAETVHGIAEGPTIEYYDPLRTGVDRKIGASGHAGIRPCRKAQFRTDRRRF